MKKILSLLAVALFATTFAAGCGKFTKCSEAGKDDCDKTDKFEKNEGDKGNCKWDAAADNGKGKCVVKGDGGSNSKAEYKVTDADKKICEDLTGTNDTECKAAHDALAKSKQLNDDAKKTHVCKFASNGKCKLDTK